MPLTVEEMVELDTRIQAQIRKQFGSLVNFCLDKTDRAKSMSGLIIGQARGFLSPRFNETNSAVVFFQNESAEQSAGDDLTEAFDESMPELSPSRLNADEQLCLLSVPDDEAGRRFATLAAQTLADVRLQIVAGSDDIVFHREHYLTPADLPQLGPSAREAFEHVLHSEQASPHSRCDVVWQTVGTS